MQAVVARINASLLRRGYRVWFDLDYMKGSTLDAMSEAVEGAIVMLYGVSKKCTQHSAQLHCALTLTRIFLVCCTDKESVNCRLECQVIFIPLAYCVCISTEFYFCNMFFDALAVRPAAEEGHDPTYDGSRLLCQGLA